MGLVKKSVQSNKNISDLCGEKYFHGILCFSSKQPRSGSRGPTHVTTRKIFNPENFSFLLGWEFFLGTNCGSRSFLLNKKKPIVLQSAKNCVYLVQSANTRFHSMGISKCIWLLPIFKRKVLQSGLSNGFVLNSIANPTLICVTLWL